MFESIEFEPGKIVYNEFEISSDISLEEQVDTLKEDMFQVNFNDKYLIDVGWYPSFTVDGSFKIAIIKEFDWSNPTKVEVVRDLSKLNELMRQYVNLVKALI